MLRVVVVIMLAGCGRLAFDEVPGAATGDGGTDVAAIPTYFDPCDGAFQRVTWVFPRGGEDLFWPEFHLTWSSQLVGGNVRVTRSPDGVTFVDPIVLPDTGSALDPWDTSHGDLDHFLRIEALGEPSLCDTTTAKVFVQSD